MARTREEIISEMVDSGLFSDDEIRQAVKEADAKNSGIIKKGWDALAWPEKKSREGLKMIADAIPDGIPLPAVTGNPVTDVVMAANPNLQRPGLTGSLPIDVIKGAPKVIADTLAETAPGFVSRGSIVTAGALKGAKIAKPAIKAIGGAVAKTAESASGLEYNTPGVLTEAARDPRLIFGKGTKAVRAMYGKTDDVIRAEMKEIPDDKQLVEKALSWLKEGNLSPEEALEARKALDKSKRQFAGPFFRSARAQLDEVAKLRFKSADASYARGIKVDALRQPLPVNKYGGTSIFKTSLGGLSGVMPVVAMSPAAQGAVATLLGIGARGVNALARTPIQSGSAIGKLLELMRGDAESR